MNKETIDLLRDMAEKLGTTTEYLWGVLIQQAYVSGLLSVAYVALLLTVFIALIAALVIHIKRSDDTEEVNISIFVLIAVSILGAIMISHGVGDAVTALANPEYWALKQIIK